MASVYVMHADGSTQLMDNIRCKSEDLELQRILEQNPDLLPGDQIDPEDPRRWLLIKREMPVPDPATGTDRWSIDFVFADQDAIPTFVECKRSDDTRARREVVGQMLEYAANGHYYWNKETLRSFAEQAAAARGQSLDDALRSLMPSTADSPDTFFETLEQNLREGQLRIVFFLERSPMELRSVVDFLNKQMERSEVLLVEARQYRWEGTRVVVPVLFGYTEQARQVKRSVTITTAGSRKRWDRSSYFADAEAKLTPSDVKVLEQVLDQAIRLGYEISWGSGAANGSFNVKDPAICPRSLLTFNSDGRMYFNSSWLNGSETAERGRDVLKDLLVGIVGLDIPDNYPQSAPGFPVSAWAPKALLIERALEDLAGQFHAAAR
jgi:hypothetical protein